MIKCIDGHGREAPKGRGKGRGLSRLQKISIAPLFLMKLLAAFRGLLLILNKDVKNIKLLIV